MKTIIEELWEVRDTLSKKSIKEPEIKKAILDTIDNLDKGKIKLAYKENLEWKMHEWIKKAIILFMKINENNMLVNGTHKYFDNLPLKFDSWDYSKFETANIKITPNSTIRKGSFISNGSIIKSSFIDIGCFIDENTIIDFNSTLGVGVQIGKNCHIESYVGIEGNFNPVTMPTIIEDNIYIGAKSQIGNEIIIEEGSIIAPGTIITKTTPILDLETNQTYYGQIPPYSVVKPTFKDGKYLVIISHRIEKLKRKEITISEILKD